MTAPDSNARRRKLRGVVLLLLLSVLLAPPAYANVVLRSLVFIWPAMWLLLPIVILLEAEVAERTLGTDFHASLKIAGAANLQSTLLGIPLAWVFLLALQLVIALLGLSSAAVVGQRPRTFWEPLAAVVGVATHWGANAEGLPAWMAIIGIALLWVGCFFLSVWYEDRVARRYFEKQQWPQVRRWAWLANGLSYSLILLVHTMLLQPMG